jgi:hypothetical protein
MACDPCKDESGGEGIAVEGFELYDLYHPNTDGSIRIFHDGNGAIESVNVDANQFAQEGRVQARFTPEALAVLSDAVAQLESGADLGGFSGACLSLVDAPVTRLSLSASGAGLQFSYPLQCAPPLLAALDEMCRDVIAGLPTCSTSPWFQDCQLVE